MVGYMLAHEQFPVPELVGLGAAAAQAGFGLLATSDHFQPWQANEGHTGEAWVTLGALGERARPAWIGTTVTCPTLRYHPAVVAEGRVFLGVGSGEALNEKAATGTWPAWPERWERLVEALAVIRALWSGQQVTHQGKYYTVDGKLYDPPAAFACFLPAASPKPLTSISRTVRRWALHHRSDKSLQDLAEMYNPCIRGWINYYSHFYKTHTRRSCVRP